MGIAYWGIRNNSNYTITTDGKLLEIGRSRRFNTSVPVVLSTNQSNQVAGGFGHTLSIQSNGTLWAWGYNFNGQLGLSNLTNRSSPTQIGNLSTWTQIASGLYHSLGIQSGGTLWAWGYNANGPLGLLDTTDRSRPVQILPSYWSKIADGYYHSLAIQSNGTLWTSGYNSTGQLGLSDSVSRSSPTQVGTLSIWTQIAGGFTHSMAIQSNGTLWAWGDNNIYGQLGLNTITSSISSPIQVGSLSTWTQISAAGSHSLAIQSNGTLWSWGYNAYGQLGLSDITNRSSPTQVGTLSIWTQIVAGRFHSLALQSNGTLWSCGYNVYGQLGLSDITNRSSPTPIGSLSTWTQIAAGQYHSLGIQSGGTLWSWGLNSYGQLGTSDLTHRSSPVQVGSLSVWTKISGGFNHSLALQSNGTLWSWGYNSNGQLGFSDTTSRSTPTQVGSLSTWTKLKFGVSNSSFAILSNGILYAWGSSVYGTIGNFNAGSVYVPSTILIPATVPQYNWTKTFGGFNVGESSFAIQSDGTLWAWGYNNLGPLGLSDITNRSIPNQVGNLSTWTQVATGFYHTLGLQSNSTLWSWGGNSYGALGTSDLTHRSSPVQVGSLSVWTKIAGGQFHSLALQSNGTLWSWGWNAYGQLGNNSNTNQSSPIQVGSLSVWTQVAAGSLHTLAIQSNGTLWSWGYNQYGALGNNSYLNNFSSPIQIGNSSLWTQIFCGYNHSLAIQSNGTLWSWGYNPYGQLGFDGNSYRISASVVGLPGTTWAKLPVGTQGTAWSLVVDGTGNLYGFGDNTGWAQNYLAANPFWYSSINTQAAYSIGDGQLIASPSFITSNVSQVTVGNQAAAFLKTDGTMWAWGINTYGQLGISISTTPTGGIPTLGPEVAPFLNNTNWKIFGSSIGYHNFAIQSNGALWAWGYNGFGQLGNSSTANQSSPTQIGTLSVWTKMAPGFYHSLAIQSNGTLWSLGGNSYGQLGTSDLTHRSSPVQVGNLSTWTQISAGNYHSLALQSNSTIWSWGANSYGQLGLSDLTNRSSPVQVGASNTWTQVATGMYHNLAIQSGGTLWLWGWNGINQLGQGTGDTSSRLSPVQITPIYWSNIATGVTAKSTLGVQSNGTLWAAGLNNSGVLGNNSTTNQSSLIQVGNLSSWTKVGCSYNFAVALQSNGSMWAWGSQAAVGLLGNNSSFGVSSPIQIGSLSVWTQVSVGVNHSLAIQSNGTLWTWGNNGSGQLGTSDITNRSTPSQVGASSTWTQISGGNTFSLALQSGGSLWAWGNNGSGQLGFYDITQRSSPTQILPLYWSKVASSASNGSSFAVIQTNGTLWVCGYNQFGQLGTSDATSRSSPTQIGNLSTWTQVSSALHTLAIQSNGTLWAWGNNSYGQLGLSDLTNRSSPVQVGANLWKQAFTGRNWTLAIQSNGTLWAWGLNSWGQLGLSDQNNRYSPTQVGSLSVWTQISAGYYHALAIQSDGSLWSWGYNIYGQLGLSDTTNRSTPTQVGSLSTWTKISVSFYNSLAIQSNGTLYAWGWNSSGQIGNNTSNISGYVSAPLQIGVSSAWTQVASGQTHSVGIQSDGSLWVWGSQQYGQLGLNSSSLTGISTPLQITSVSGWSQVFCGYSQTYGILSNGTFYAFGQDTVGQLGLGFSGSSRSTPSTILIPAYIPQYNWTQISAGANHSLAVHSNGSLWSWGSNASGQLGLSDTISRSIPTQVGNLNIWTKATGGPSHSFAIQSNGTLWACGYQSNGRLGNNSSNTNSISTFTQIGSLSGWSQMTTGFAYSLGLQSNGTALACGYGNPGNLGLGSTGSPIEFFPLLVPANSPVSNWTQVSCGYAHNLAIQSNGTLWTWGYNQFGQLGTSDITNRGFPIQVGNLSTWTQISAGYNHSLGVQSDGTLWSWGYNSFGVLATSDITNRYSPVKVGTLSNWSQIVPASGGVIASLSSGTIYAWGNNTYSQLVRDNNIVYSPVQIGTSSNWTKVVYGYSWAMAQDKLGNMYSWGYNAYGQLGQNSTINFFTPTQIAALGSQVVQFACGYYHAAFVKYDGTLWAVGNNSYGQLGQGDYTHRSTPVQVGTISQYTNVFALNYTTLANLL